MNEKFKKFLNYVYVFLAGVGSVILVLIGRSFNHGNRPNNAGTNPERDRIDATINRIDRGLGEVKQTNTDSREQLERLETINTTIADAKREIEQSNLNVTDRLERSKELNKRNIQLLAELQKRTTKSND